MKDILRRNNVNITGKGAQTMLFVHGFGCDQTVWKKMVPAFIDNYKIILFDFVGAGMSDVFAYDRSRYGTLNGYAEDILEIAEVLNLENIILVAHSVSCMTGALAAIKNPGIFEKLIFIGPSPRYLNDADYIGGFEKKDLDHLFELMDDDYISWAHATAPAIMGSAQPAELGQELSDSFCLLDPDIAKDFARVTFLSDNRKDLPQIPVESLTLQCTDDILAPIAVGKYILQHTPKNELVILEATGHCPHMSAPAETIQAIRAFLS
jgi:sigma-B regulation protein RsbQ